MQIYCDFDMKADTKDHGHFASNSRGRRPDLRYDLDALREAFAEMIIEGELVFAYF